MDDGNICSGVSYSQPFELETDTSESFAADEAPKAFSTCIIDSATDGFNSKNRLGKIVAYVSFKYPSSQTIAPSKKLLLQATTS